MSSTDRVGSILGTTRYDAPGEMGQCRVIACQRRAEALRLVASEPRQRELLDGEAVAALEADGLVQVRGGLVTLPR